MNQADLRTLTDERLLDAAALLAGGRWAFAYYVAGYAVECALKSCVLARMVHTGWIFQDKAKIQDCLTHDFADLVRLAGLQPEWDVQKATNPAFDANWTVARQWRVDVRYTPKSQAEAEELYNAITHDPDGVLSWLKTYW